MDYCLRQITRHLLPSMQTFCFISSVTKGLNIFHRRGNILGAAQRNDIISACTIDIHPFVCFCRVSSKEKEM